MPNVLGSVQKKIKGIQRSSQATKKVWLFILSAVSMSFVLIVWLIYLNASMPKIVTEESDAPEAVFKPSVFSVFSRGLSVVSREVADKVIGLKNEIQKATGFISQESKNFSLDRYLNKENKNASSSVSGAKP